jgi:phosphatidylglycerol lysyltransferase
MRGYRFQPASEAPGHTRAPATRRIRPIQLLPIAAPAVVAGSGLLNLFSVTGGPAPSGQPAWLRCVFPLDFTPLHKTATLLLGFALILTAIHLAGLKRRALYLAVCLSLVSAAIHLTKAWNVAETASVLAFAAILVAGKKAFPFGSARPDLALALKRAALAVGVAAMYGAAGFWLLEPREFGRNFHWWEAAARTLRVMLQLGDAGLSPRTPYAAWFLDSLSLLSVSAFLYCGVTLFRPVSWRLRQNDTEWELARSIAEQHGCSGQDYFKLRPDKTIFLSKSRKSFIAYRVANHFALVLGDPVGPENELQAAIEQFVDYCHRQGWRVGFHQVRAGRLELYRKLGFHYLKVGDDAVADLTSFSLEGSAMKEFRNTVNRLERLGYRVAGTDPPIEAGLLEELKRVSDEWLSLPNHRERNFTLGRFDPAYVRTTKVYVAFDPQGRVAAFLNLIPSYRPGLATIDLMRRRGESVNGIMDYLFAKTFLSLRAEGVERVSLGMAPGTQRGDRTTIEEKAVAYLMRRFPSVFRVEGLRRFKAKYARCWEPLYSVYRSRWDLPRLALALQKISEDSGGVPRAA